MSPKAEDMGIDIIPDCATEPLPKPVHTGADGSNIAAESASKSTPKIRKTEALVLDCSVASCDRSPDLISYDFTRDTEFNHGTGDGPNFVGEFAELRKTLDYKYHAYYSKERQAVQDMIINKFMATVVKDSKTHMFCARPSQPWLIFTAGAMGSGKSHLMGWLDKWGLFPLASFVQVDPDKIRYQLPEWEEYLARDPTKAGTLTHKEAGFIAELLTLEGLRQGKNVIVDGSLRDSDWYSTYFAQIRQRHLKVKLAIVHCMAEAHTIRKRVAKRSERTGRDVPLDILQETIEQVPTSVNVLAPQVDLVVRVNTDGHEPQLVSRSSTWEEFGRLWVQECIDGESFTSQLQVVNPSLVSSISAMPRQDAI